MSKPAQCPADCRCPDACPAGTSATRTTRASRPPSNWPGKAFIFGQEPDEIKGDFDHLESFLGELGELSIWGHIVSDMNISRMANCKDDGHEKKGDIIAWEVNNFIVNRARVHEGIDTKMFCNPVQKYVVFPQKRLFKDAKKIFH